MNKVCACLDGLATTAAVIDWAVWSAQRLSAPLELLHVMDRHPERALSRDYSGAIGLGAQESLLEELSALDEKRSHIAQEVGRQLLVSARARAAAAGVTQLDARLRHGELVDNLLEMEPDVRLFVMGGHARTGTGSKIHLDHHVERVIRSVKRPVLVANAAPFEAPQRVVLAYDGSANGDKTVHTVARSPLLLGLPVLLVTAGTATDSARQSLVDAACVLQKTGFNVSTELLPGEPEQVLPPLLAAQGAALLVMGAYGHSRIRQLIVGSTTSTLLRMSPAPVLVLR